MKNKFVSQVINELTHIKVNDFLNLYGAIYSIIFVGAAVVIGVTSHTWALIILLLAPFSVVVLAILTNILITNFRDSLSETESEKVSSKSIALHQIRFGEGWQKNPLKSKFHNVHEIDVAFPLVNQSGHDLTDCLIFLDTWCRRKSDDSSNWELVSEDFPKPFKWTYPIPSSQGKITLENEGRASFVLFREVNAPQDMGTNSSIVFFDDEKCTLYPEWQHEMVIRLRGTDENKKKIVIKWVVIIIARTAGGIEIQSIERVW